MPAVVSFDNNTLKTMLAAGKYVTKNDLVAAEQWAAKHRTSLLEYLLQEQLLTKDLLGQAIAEHYQLPYADLNSHVPEADQARRIPEAVAKKYRAVLFEEKPKQAIVTTDQPEQMLAKIADLAKLFPKKKIVQAYSLPEDIDAVFLYYRKTLATRFASIIKGQKRVAPEIIEEILGDALSYRASDIHFEPQKAELVVRFRVDGVLLEAGRIPREYYENMLNRIKVQSRLRIDEHFAAQDGSMHVERDGLAIDLRTSIVPTIEGEKVVLRVLAAYVQGFTLGDLGLSPRYEELLKTTAGKPFGMILVTGPTGSGKTTTLYALLKILNRPEDNIMTIEDPVEYKLIGVNQIQVNPQTNLTFAKGLRSIVRQDPDIILVGEIRDHETAEIAVNAALTGHLLLSTFHANDAATAIPRLLDMGVEPFLLASTLDLVVAQRLARKICDQCRHSVSADSKNKKFTRYEGKGCGACGQTGYKGRTAIFECIAMTPEMQALILTRPSARQIWQLAKTQGARSLFDDGLEKIKNGATTLAELLRVAEPPQE